MKTAFLTVLVTVLASALVQAASVTPPTAAAIPVAPLPVAPPPLLPSPGVVIQGTASVSQAGNVLTVTNSNGAIINWNNFSVPAGGAIQFAQPSASSVVLNRVNGNVPTAILGKLSSNGRVFLVNPAGIIITPGGGRLNPATLVVPRSAFTASAANLPPAPAATALAPRGALPTVAPVNTSRMVDGAVTLRTSLVDASPIQFR